MPAWATSVAAIWSPTELGRGCPTRAVVLPWRGRAQPSGRPASRFAGSVGPRAPAGLAASTGPHRPVSERRPAALPCKEAALKEDVVLVTL